MAKMNATNVLNAFHDFLNEDEDSDGYRLAEFLAKNNPTTRKPLFGDIQPDSFDYEVELEAVDRSNVTANNSKQQSDTANAVPEVREEVVVEKPVHAAEGNTEAVNAENVQAPKEVPKSPRCANLTQSARLSMRRSCASPSADRLRRYSMNRLSATKRRALIKEFESTVCSDEFSPNLYSTRMDMHRNSNSNNNNNSKENRARTFTIEKTNDPNEILLKYIDQSSNAARTTQKTPTKAHSPAKVLSRLLSPLRMASMSRNTSPKLTTPSRVTTPPSHQRPPVGCKSPLASPCQANALHCSPSVTMKNKSNLSVARDSPRNRTVLAENTPTRAPAPPLEDAINAVDDGIQIPETQDLPAGTQNLIAACRRSQTPVIVIPVTQIVRNNSAGDTTPTHPSSSKASINKTVIEANTPTKMNRTLQSTSITAHEMPAQMSIRSLGHRSVAATPTHQSPSKLRLSDIMTDDELETSAPTVSSSLTRRNDTTSKPLNLAKKRKLRKRSSTARETQPQIPRVATHRAPLNLRSKRNNEEQEHEFPSQLPLNKPPCTPINGEKFAVELKMNLARMTNRQILDLRKRNSMGKVFLFGAAKTLPDKKLALEKQLNLEESIQWELLKRDCTGESPKRPTLQLSSTPAPPSLTKKRKSRASTLRPPPQFCDSYKVHSLCNMPVDNEVEVETTLANRHVAHIVADEGVFIEDVAVENIIGNEDPVADVVIDAAAQNSKNGTLHRNEEQDELMELVQRITENEVESSLVDESICDRITFNPSRTSTVNQGKTKLRNKKHKTPNTVRKYLNETKKVQKRSTRTRSSSKRSLYTKGLSDTENENISDISGIRDLSPKSCTLTHASKATGRISPTTPNMRSVSTLPVPPSPFCDVMQHQQHPEQPIEPQIETSVREDNEETFKKPASMENKPKERAGKSKKDSINRKRSVDHSITSTETSATEDINTAAATSSARDDKDETFKKPAPVKNKPKARGGKSKKDSINRKRTVDHTITSTETSGTEGTNSEDTNTGETTLRRSKRNQTARTNNWSMRPTDAVPLPQVMYMSLLLRRLNAAERNGMHKNKFSSYADVLDSIKSEVNHKTIEQPKNKARSRSRAASIVATSTSNAETVSIPEEQLTVKPQKTSTKRRKKLNSTTRSNQATSTTTADDIEPQINTMSKLALSPIVEDVAQPDSPASLRTQSVVEKPQGNKELMNTHNSTMGLERSRLQITAAPVEQINRLFDNHREQGMQMQTTTETSSTSDNSSKTKRLQVRVRRTPMPETLMSTNKKKNNKQTKAAREEPTANAQTDKNLELISWLKSVTSLDNNKSKDHLFQELRCSSLDNVVITELDGIDSVFYTNNNQNNSDLGYLRFKPHQMKPPKRSKSYSLNYVVLTGKFKILTHNEVGIFQNGDLVTINRGVRYSIENDSDDIGILMVVKR